MIRRQLISFGAKSTDFRMGYGALSEFSRMVSHVVATPKRSLVVTREDLEEGAGLEVSRALIDAGFSVDVLMLPAEGSASTLERAMELYGKLDACGITMDDVVVGFGDSDLCALTGFCARTWCGGTSYALVPTTLDAMATAATSSVALDLGASREMASVEPRAALVVCDLDLVRSCDHDSLLLGFVDLLAASLIDSRRQWDRFGGLVEGLVEGDEVALLDTLGMAQTSRAAVINSSNPSARNALQFGVTTGRALREALGEGVAWYRLLAEGMRFEARLAHDVCGLEIDDVFDLDDRLEDLGIAELPFALSRDRFVEALKSTRFKRTNRFMFSLPRHPGTVRFTVVDDDVLERHADAYLAARAGLLEDRG